MKWAALVIALAAILPFAGWLRANSQHAPKVWVAFGLMPFIVNSFNLDMSVIDWAAWPGYAKGVQITLLDLMALGILISLPRGSHPRPFKLVAGTYFVAVVISIFHAQVPMAAVFYAWQLARVLLVYAVVAQACEDIAILRAILTGMVIGLCYQAALAVWQRYGLGKLQVGGSFGHQNTLGLVSHFVIYPVFALLLAGERGWQTVIAPLAGLAIAVLTTSRATLGLVAGGLFLIFALSSLRGWTARKTSVLLIGTIAIGLLAPIAISSFEKRFTVAPLDESAYDERAAFEKAASLILADRPFGAGANNYVIVANTGGYSDRAGVAWAAGSRTALVHNAYWLAAAETGYLGAIGLLLIMVRSTTVALRAGWTTRRDVRGDLLLGIGVALLMVALHCLYEWGFFFAFIQYLFAISLGMVAGLRVQVKSANPSHFSRQKKTVGPLFETGRADGRIRPRN